MRIALLHEHPTWSQELIERAQARGLDLVPIDITTFDVANAAAGSFDLWVNRINAMPSAGRPTSIVAAAGHLLASLELAGHSVLNGSFSHRVGGSKAAQAALFSQLGLGTPATAALHRPIDAIEAAQRLGLPVLTKPNIGGSGSGIMRHDTVHDLQASIEAGDVDLGIDGTGVVQQVIESADNTIYRVEMLGDSLFYGTTQRLHPGIYNYCAADGCAIEPGGDAITLFTPPTSVLESVAHVMLTAKTDVGGIEYIIDAATGEPSYFDFNPYSNFVSGFDEQLGFNPIDRYLDFIFSGLC